MQRNEHNADGERCRERREHQSFSSVEIAAAENKLRLLQVMDGNSVLLLACEADNYELAKVLLAMEVDVEKRDATRHRTPLMEATERGNEKMVRLLLEYGADVNALSTWGSNPLMCACSNGHQQVVTLLLDANADVENRNSSSDDTPLIAAAEAGHSDVAKILLDHGAVLPSHLNDSRQSPLTQACLEGHLDMVRLLIDAYADQKRQICDQ